MEPRLVRCVLRSAVMGLVLSAATYMFIWALATTHQELGIPNGAALSFAARMFPAFFLGSLIVLMARLFRHRKH